MARGDVIIFEEARADLINGRWASNATVYCGVITNDVAPSASFTTPTFATFTEVATTTDYTAGGMLIGDLASMVTEADGVVTFDAAVNPTWSQNSSGDASAYYGIIYCQSDATGFALGYVDLGGPVDMSAGDLTITWNSSGIFKLST